MEVSHCLPALTPTGHRVRAVRWPRCHRRRCRVGMEQDDSMHRLRLNSSSSPCVCIFRFIAMAVRRHSTYRPRFVPVQDAQRRHGADRMAKVCAGGWEGAAAPDQVATLARSG